MLDEMSDREEEPVIDHIKLHAKAIQAARSGPPTPEEQMATLREYARALIAFVEHAEILSKIPSKRATTLELKAIKVAMNTLHNVGQPGSKIGYPVAIEQLRKVARKLIQARTAHPAQAKRIAKLGLALATLQRTEHETMRRNIGFVCSIAKRYRVASYHIEDRIQDGCLGMLRAMLTFDADRGYSFLTYSSWWIRQSIREAIGNNRQNIRLPAQINDRARRAERKLAHGEALEPREQAAQTHYDLSRTVSLDKNLPGSMVTYAQVARDLRPLADERLASAEVHVLSHKLLAKLTPKEIDILQLRCGLDQDSAPEPSDEQDRSDHEGLTLQEIGQRYGVTRERIRQIEEQALRKLRQKLYRDELDIP